MGVQAERVTFICGQDVLLFCQEAHHALSPSPKPFKPGQKKGRQKCLCHLHSLSSLTASSPLCVPCVPCVSPLCPLYVPCVPMSFSTVKSLALSIHFCASPRKDYYLVLRSSRSQRQMQRNFKCTLLRERSWAGMLHMVDSRVF